MKNQRIFLAFVIFLVLLITIFVLLRYYSGQVNIRRDSYFEISTRIKGEYRDAENTRNNLNGRIESQIVIEKVSKNVYDLVFGKFHNSYNAGEAAFNLFSDSLITNYSIMLDGEEAVDNYSNVLFVAREEERASIFSLNLPDKKTTPLWSDWGEDVVSLEQSPDKNICYYLTVNSFGKKGSMSHLNDARLYNYVRVANKIRMVDYLKNGIQFYSYWNAKSNYMTSFLSLDSASNQNVIQSIAIYDTTGAKISEQTKSFNLIKDGFPNPPQPKLDYTSTMNKYIVFSKKNAEGGNSLFLKKTYTEDGYLIADTKGSFNEIAWSNDDKYLFFIYSDIRQLKKKVSKTDYFLMIYDADTKKIIRKFDPQDFRSISVLGRLLVIETGSGPDSKILFYDYLKDEIYYSLSVIGGCAIKNLPLIK